MKRFIVTFKRWNGFSHFNILLLIIYKARLLTNIKFNVVMVV